MEIYAADYELPLVKLPESLTFPSNLASAYAFCMVSATACALTAICVEIA